MPALDVGGVLLAACSIFFALNMGGAGFSPSFSAALGAGIVRRGPALVLFTICVGLGGVLIGGHVARTLGSNLVPAETIDRHTALVVIGSATAALFVANLAKIPESTSWVTVFAVSSLGVVRGNLNWDTILHRLLPAWVIVPVVAFFGTYLLARQLYPLRGWNYRIYEHLTKHEWKLRVLVITSSAYLAVAVGANNLANVVAPLASAGVFEVQTGMVLFTPLFALGGIVFFRSTKTIGSDVVPLGLYSASIMNVVVGSIVLVVSWLGLPQSLVHAQVLAVFGIALAKDGVHDLLRNRVVRRIALFWAVSPLVASTLVALLLLLFD
ncbi:MAG TPA: inorganic phosphate transporter [Kofleriaceae bacterium]|nr:inorganic phosphate transporter [Kofleriaceae bacterium]